MHDVYSFFVFGTSLRVYIKHYSLEKCYRHKRIFSFAATFIYNIFTLFTHALAKLMLRQRTRGVEINLPRWGGGQVKKRLVTGNKNRLFKKDFLI